MKKTDEFNKTVVKFEEIHTRDVKKNVVKIMTFFRLMHFSLEHA